MKRIFLMTMLMIVALGVSTQTVSVRHTIPMNVETIFIDSFLGEFNRNGSLELSTWEEADYFMSISLMPTETVDGRITGYAVALAFHNRRTGIVTATVGISSSDTDGIIWLARSSVLELIKFISNEKDSV